MKKIITIILGIILVFAIGITAYGATIEYTDNNGITQKISDFKDTKAHWAHDVILKWADYDIVVGNQGNFMPNSNIKRGDLCLIFSRLLGLSDVSYNYFNDLPNQSYYRDAVLQCVAAGYISGTSSTTVDPNGYATREQVAVIITRMFDLDTSNIKNVRKFADDYNIGSWARDSVYAMRAAGYMNGNGNNMFNPKSNITRAEIMQVLNNIAGTYIPNRDRYNQGSTFKTVFNSNAMIARQVSLINSTVQGDLILTPHLKQIDIAGSEVKNRIFVMSKAVINLNDCKVNQIYLKEGKSSITGASCADTIYICSDASESYIDVVPNSLILEPGTRVRIDTVYYENTTNDIKTFKGKEILQERAAEQGYVVGGPKLTTAFFKQDLDNNIRIENMYVTKGLNQIEEIGIIWLEQKNNTDIILPTISNCSGSVKYKSQKFNDVIEFTANQVKGTCAYRVYAKDKEGLYAYSNCEVFTEYDFDIDLSLYDINYPEKFGAELVIDGNNVPTILEVRLLFDTNEEYSANHSYEYMSRYNYENTIQKPDESKYNRYTLSLLSNVDFIKGEKIYCPPTVFGYFVKFDGGYVVQKFPVLSNAIPVGAKPLSELNSGTPSYDTNQIRILNNTVITSYIEVLEEGMVYLSSYANNISDINKNFDTWERKSINHYIGVNETYSYNITIPITDENANTFYCPYVKTANGYYYGNIQYVSNNYKGDIGGYIIDRVKAYVFDSDVLLEIYSNSSTFVDDSILCLGENLAEKPLYLYESANGKYYSYVLLRNLTEKDTYNFMIRLTKATGEKSNIYPLAVNMHKDSFGLYVTNKTINSTNTNYKLNCYSNMLNFISWDNLRTKNTNTLLSLNTKDYILSVPKGIETDNESVIAHFLVPFNGKSFEVQQTFSLY